MKISSILVSIVLIISFFCNAICDLREMIDLRLRLNNIDDYVILEIFQIEIEK